jgi:hypothetical protein
MLYSAVLIAAIVEFALYRIPVTRRWMRPLTPNV